jgi:hypothetical protein
MATHTDKHIEKTLNAFEAIKPIVFKNVPAEATA